MTDELDQTTIGEPGAEGPLSGLGPGESAAESQILAGIPTLGDVDLSDVEDAAKWVWRHTLGDDDDDKPSEPMTANVEFEAEEEVTTETSNVEHDDPPPPERPTGEPR
jgi:hypothetical protein